MSMVEKVKKVGSVTDVKTDDLPLKEVKAKGAPLHEVFKNDTQAKADEKEEAYPSLLKRILSMLPFAQDTKTTVAAAPMEKSEEIKISSAKPISPIPVLEKPEDFEEDEKTISPFNYNKGDDIVSNVSDKKIMEKLTLLSTYTLEQIVAFVLKAQLEIEKDSAITTQDTFTKLHNLKKIHQRTLQQVKDLLVHDEKIAGRFQTAQSVTRAASLVCGLAAIVVTLGGVAVPATIASLAVAGTAVSGGFDALVSTGKAYTESTMNQHKATLTKSSHEDKNYDEKIATQHDHMLNIADSNNMFSEFLMKLLKIRNRQSQAIHQ
jgi:hypothetical protein